MFHGASSAGYCEIHPQVWYGWCADAGVPSEPLPDPSQRPLYGYPVCFDPSLIDGAGRPMGYLRNPFGIDVTIAEQADEARSAA